MPKENQRSKTPKSTTFPTLTQVLDDVKWQATFMSDPDFDWGYFNSTLGLIKTAAIRDYCPKLEG